MKYACWFLVGGISFFLLGCAGSQPASPRASSNTQALSAGGDDSSDASRQIAQANAQMPPIPEGAMYTLLCASFTGNTHINDANRAKQYLIQRTGWHGWYIVHSAGESDLFYGFYTTFDDRSQAKEYTRAQNDRAQVAALVDADGNPMFSQVTFVPIDLPDPPAPREWQLESNPGFWTLQIGIYRDSPQRKQAAVNAVKEARAEGIEAYFHHDKATSEVFVGSWPRNAVKQEEASSGSSDDPNQPLLVMSGPLAGAEHSNFYTPDGRKMKVMMPKLEILDPGLKQTMAKYPYTEINGEVLGRKVVGVDHTTKVIPFPSVLVQVPKPDNSDEEDQDQTMTDTGDNGSSDNSSNAGAMPAQPSGGEDNGIGGLR